MIKDKIRKIKYSRLSDIDKYFLELIKDVKRIKEDDNKYYWVKNNSIIFEERINSKIIFFSRILWVKLNNKFNNGIDSLVLQELSHNYLVNNSYMVSINSMRGEETWDIVQQKYVR